MIINRDELYRCVCCFITPTPMPGRAGTGIFIARQTGEQEFRGWLVTATHVVTEFTHETKLLICDANNNANEYQIPFFAGNNGWEHHAEADVSKVAIQFTQQNQAVLQNRFFPAEQMRAEPGSVSRDDELTAIGFPLGLGGFGKFAPLTFRTFAASPEITLARADTGTPSDFIALEKSAIGGYSGGPVFDLGVRLLGQGMQVNSAQTTLHGITHGTIGDQNGRMGLVTPTSYLAPWLQP